MGTVHPAAGGTTITGMNVSPSAAAAAAAPEVCCDVVTLKCVSRIVLGLPSVLLMLLLVPAVPAAAAVEMAGTVSCS